MSKTRTFFVYEHQGKLEIYREDPNFDHPASLAVTKFIEYSAYEVAHNRRFELLDSANRWAAQAKAERAKNAKLVAALKHIELSTGRFPILLGTIKHLAREALAENSEIKT